MDATFAFIKKNMFPLSLTAEHENISRLRELAGVLLGILTDIDKNPEAGQSTPIVIQHSLLMFAYMTRDYQRGQNPMECDRPPSEPSLSRPRRPRLQVYERGDERPRAVTVLRC